MGLRPSRIPRVLGGDPVQLESPRASVECQARVSEDIRPQVEQLYPEFKEDNANLLTDSGPYDPITGSVPMRSSLSQISKALA